MELKPGYKLTDVGVIPEDWDAAQLKGRVEIAHGFPFESQHFVAHGTYRLTTPGHFYEDGGFRDIGEKQKFYDGPVPTGYVLRLGDLIVAMTEQADGLLGSAALIPQADSYLHNQRLGRIKVSTTQIDVQFLYYIFNASHFRSKVRETAAGTKVKHTSPQKLLDIAVPLPPPAEQRAITGALSDVDALIGALDQLIAKKRDLKQAAMQQLLTGHQRLPGFAPANPRFQKTDVGMIPDDWEVGILGRCLSESPSYGINAPAVPHDDKLPTYIRITDITVDGRFSPDKLSSVKAAGTERYFLQDGDIVFARTGASVGKSYRYDPKDGELVFAGFLIRVRPNPGRLSPTFLAAFATTGMYWNWVLLMSMRSGQPGINGNEYARLPLPMPPLAEQTAIAEVLSDMDAELAALEQKRDKTRLLKQGMMQELLTGRTRLI